MIPLHLPPGTRIVCVERDAPPWGDPVLEIGCIYTLRDYVPPDPACDDYGVRVNEIFHRIHPVLKTEIAFLRRRFKLAVLPREFTDCLTSTDITDELEVV